MAGNWKMNKTRDDAFDFAQHFKEIYKENDNVDVVICSPATSIYRLSQELKDTNIAVGAQNMHSADSGTFTGEISADMLMAAGATYVILGHSDRRQKFGENNDIVNKKLLKAIGKGLTPIFCCGESLEKRQSGRTEEKLRRQIIMGFYGVTAEEAKKVIIAYEPVWAISKGVVLKDGNSLVATPEVANEACKLVRNIVKEMYGDDVAENITILYGGSMASDNSAELLAQPDIDGGLIGGASLNPEEFANTILNALK